MKLNYNNRTNRFSLSNLTEIEANAILRGLSIIKDKMDYNERYGYYVDRGDCFALDRESYEAIVMLCNQLEKK